MNLWNKVPHHKEIDLLLHIFKIRGDTFQNFDKNSSPDSRISVPTDIDYLLSFERSRKNIFYVHTVIFWLANIYNYANIPSPSPLWLCAPTRARASSFLMFLDHTQRHIIVSRTPLDAWSAHRRDLYLTTHNTHNRQKSMPLVGFEPTISAGERPHTYALDRAAAGTGNYTNIYKVVTVTNTTYKLLEESRSAPKHVGAIVI